MRRLLALFAAALWWGGLAGVAALAVPLLFVNLPLPAMAWMVASQFFVALMWLALGCGLLLVLALKSAVGAGRDDAALGVLMWTLTGMLLAVLLEFVIAPHVRVRDQLPLWGSAGVVVLVLQWGCAGMCLWRIATRKEPL